MASLGGPNIVTNGLVLELDAGNVKSYPGTGSTWIDKSGNGNNGTLTNGPTFNSLNGGSIVFDGTNDYVTIPSTSNLSPGTGDFTFSCFLYPTDYSATYGPIFVTAATNGLWIGRNGNLFVLRAYAVADRLQYSVLPSLNTWTYISITRIGTLASLYYNGSLMITSTTNQDFIQNTNYIGSDGNVPLPSGAYFTGRIALLNFYKAKGLTSQEVLQNYNAIKSRYNLK